MTIWTKTHENPYFYAQTYTEDASIYSDKSWKAHKAQHMCRCDCFKAIVLQLKPTASQCKQYFGDFHRFLSFKWTATLKEKEQLSHLIASSVALHVAYVQSVLIVALYLLVLLMRYGVLRLKTIAVLKVIHIRCFTSISFCWFWKDLVCGPCNQCNKHINRGRDAISPYLKFSC